MRSDTRHSDCGVSRREALKFLGSATALPLFHPTLTHQPTATTWQPKFLDVDDVETVATLARCITSPAETPGARDATLLEYIDAALSRADSSVQSEFNEGLAWLETRVAGSRKQRFTELDRQEQFRLLAEISDTSRSHEPQGYAFFTQIKQLAIEGYYCSGTGTLV